MHHTQVSAEAVGLEYAGLVVVVTCDEVRIEVWCQLHVSLADSVHSRDEPDVLDIGLDQPDVGTQADKERDWKHQEGEDAKRLPEASSLRHQGKRYHDCRENGEEDAGPAEDLAPRHATGRQQTPMFCRENLSAQGSTGSGLFDLDVPCASRGPPRARFDRLSVHAGHGVTKLTIRSVHCRSHQPVSSWYAANDSHSRSSSRSSQSWVMAPSSMRVNLACPVNLRLPSTTLPSCMLPS